MCMRREGGMDMCVCRSGGREGWTCVCMGREGGMDMCVYEEGGRDGHVCV